MLRSVLMDKLSEFLMVEQGGYQLYTVVEARCTNPDLKTKYTEFLAQTGHHREVLVRLIEQLGGDPNYISPTARVAQFKATQLLESSLVVDGLSQPEVEANDLENVLLAETRDHANWHLLQQLTSQLPGEQGQALQAAVDAVEDQEDEHLSWARETLSSLSLQLLDEPTPPNPLRWQMVITGPEPPIDEFHPAPFGEGLLEGSRLPVWVETPISRSLAGAGRDSATLKA